MTTDDKSRQYLVSEEDYLLLQRIKGNSVPPALPDRKYKGQESYRPVKPILNNLIETSSEPQKKRDALKVSQDEVNSAELSEKIDTVDNQEVKQVSKPEPTRQRDMISAKPPVPPKKIFLDHRNVVTSSENLIATSDITKSPSLKHQINLKHSRQKPEIPRRKPTLAKLQDRQGLSLRVDNARKLNINPDGKNPELELESKAGSRDITPSSLNNKPPVPSRKPQLKLNGKSTVENRDNDFVNKSESGSLEEILRSRLLQRKSHTAPQLSTSSRSIAPASMISSAEGSVARVDLVHYNKTRTRGPKRKLPQALRDNC